MRLDRVLSHSFKALVGLSLLGLVGCGHQQRPIEAEVRVNSIAPRQLPPEPVYNRLRWVALPEVHPLTTVSTDRLFGETRPRLLPMIHFSVSEKSVCEAAVILASTARYTSYCSSLVTERVLSVEQLGTIDELAATLASKTNSEVIVDHVNREVRVLSKVHQDEKDPRFFEKGDRNNEY